MTASSDPDREVAAIAADNYGVVDRRQLRACGLDRQAVAHRVARHRLIELYPDVYAVGHAQLRMEGKWLAAVRHCGGRAVVSHDDAAALWDIAPVRGSLIHVTMPARSGREPQTPVLLHRVGSLRADEVTVCDGIPVTTVARTLLDLAPDAGARRLEDLVAQADRRRLFDLREVRRVVDAHKRQPGRRNLIALLEMLEGGGPVDMRSPAEEALLELCDDFGIPAPLVNTMVYGFMVDFYWPDAGLIVETDGFRYHSMPTAFAEDRERDQMLMLAGYRVARFTSHQLTRRPERTTSAQRLRALLRPSGP